MCIRDRFSTDQVTQYSQAGIFLPLNDLIKEHSYYIKLSLIHIYPGRAYAFCSLTYGEGSGECLAQLQMWMRAGFDGWKILETKPSVAKLLGVRMDDERFEPAFAWAEKNQIPIIWHCLLYTSRCV